MDMNTYALEQVVAARIADMYAWRQRSALVASLRANRTRKAGGSERSPRWARRLMRWLLNVPAAQGPRPGHDEAQPAGAGVARAGVGR
jgi:hypothetical protein